METRLKRFLSLALALFMVISMMPQITIGASAVDMSGGETLYLKPNSNWLTDGARFAIYVYGGSGNGWASMTDSDGDGVYEATVPSGSWTNVIFCRMNPGTTENKWDNKWNQTDNLTYDGTNNMYTVADNTWSNGGGTWSTYNYAEPTYTVAGQLSLCGTDWDVTNTANDMTKQSDGTYTKTYTGVEQGTYELKVVQNRNWETAWPSGNYELEAPYTKNTVTITFDGSNVSATVVCEHANPLYPESPCYKTTCGDCDATITAGTGHNWSANNGICANECGTECEHEDMTAADEVCGTCGKSNPDYSVEEPANTISTEAELIAALAAGGEYTLAADITLTDSRYASADTTLNLGEYKITRWELGDSAGSLTINGGSIEDVNLMSKGKLSLNGTTVTGNGSQILLAYGDMTISNSVLKGANSDNPAFAAVAATLTLDACTVTDVEFTLTNANAKIVLSSDSSWAEGNDVVLHSSLESDYEVHYDEDTMTYSVVEKAEPVAPGEPTTETVVTVKCSEQAQWYDCYYFSSVCTPGEVVLNNGAYTCEITVNLDGIAKTAANGFDADHTGYTHAVPEGMTGTKTVTATWDSENAEWNVNGLTYTFTCTALPVASIGNQSYDSLSDAITAANAMSEAAVILVYEDIDTLPTKMTAPMTIKGAVDGIDVNCAIAEYWNGVNGTVVFENLTFNNRISTEYGQTDSNSNMVLKFVNCKFNVSGTDGYAIQAGASWNNNNLGSLIIDSCEFSYVGTEFKGGYMIYAQCVKNVTITNNVIDGNNLYRGAIHLGDSTDYATVATVENNTIKNFCRGVMMGNRVAGSKITIDGNTFENINYSSADSKAAAECAPIFIHSNASAETTDVVITDNVVVGCENPMIYSEDVDPVADYVSTFSGNTAKENVMAEAAEIVLANSYYAPNVPVFVAQIGDDKYVTLAEAFTNANPGDEIKILVAGEYSFGTTKSITITGAVDDVVFECGGNNIGMNGASVTFNNVTFNWDANGWPYHGLAHCGDMVYNNCTFNGTVFLYGTSETFNNCTFNVTGDTYNVWTYGAQEVAFNGCTFYSEGKSVLIYSEQSDLVNNVTVTDCDFVASAAVEGKAAIEMDSSLTSGINLTIDADTTATGFASGSVSGESLWNNKKGDNTVVYVNNVKVWPKVVVDVPTTEEIKTDGSSANVESEEVTKVVEDVATVVKESTVIKQVENENEGVTLEIKLAAVKVEQDGETAVATKITYNVTPMKEDVAQKTVDKAITFRLPIPNSITATSAYVYHDGMKMEGTYEIKSNDSDEQYVEVSSTNFSEYAIEPLDVDDEDVAQIGAKGYETLQAALDAVKDGETVKLIADCTEDVTVKQQNDLHFTIDGQNNTYSGKITIDGGRTRGVNAQSKTNNSVTIQNINFATSTKSHTFIVTQNSAGKTYAHNVTVKNCTFTATDAAVNTASSSNWQQCFNIVIDSCTATNMHSLVQADGGDGMTITNSKAVNCKNGISTGSTKNTVIKNCTVTSVGSDGYGIRVDGDGNVATIENVTVTAWVPVLVRNTTAEGYTLNVNGTNTLTVAESSNNTKIVVSSGDVDASKAQVTPTVRAMVVLNDTGLTGEDVTGWATQSGNTCYTIKTEAAVVSGEAVTYYDTLAEAVAAAESGATVKVLTDVTLTSVIEVKGKAVTITADEKVTITANATDTVKYDFFTAGAGGTLTLGANLAVNSNTSVLYANGGTINVEGAAISVSGSIYNAAFVGNNGTINVKSGTISQSDDRVTISAKNGTVNVSGGTVLSENSSAIAAQEGATVKISGGEVKTTCKNPAYCAVFARNATAEVTGTGVVSAAAGYGLVAVTDGTVKVTGGTVNNGVKAHENAKANAVITGGTVNGTLSAANGATIAVSGGTFEKEVAYEYCADGFIPTKNGDTYGVKVGQYTAQVGEDLYETLAEAVAAATDGQTVKVLTDVTLTDAITVTGKAVTITADKAVTTTANATDTVKYDFFTAGAGGTLTLGANLTVNSNTSVLWANGGTINVEGAAISVSGSSACAAFVGNNGTINVKSGTISQSDALVTISAKNGTVNVSGGTVLSENSSAIAAQEGATVKISGGEVKTTCEDPAYCAVFARNATAEVTGTGVVSAAAGYGLVAVTDGTVKVTGGTVNNGVKAHENTKANAVITGGTVNGTLSAANGATIAVSGGTFDQKVPEEYCALGYSPAALDGGKYGVELGFVLNADSGKNYGTIAQALAAAQSGETLQLLQDHEEDTVIVNNGVTLDLNGQTLKTGYLAAFSGSHVIDSNTEKGLLIVSQNKIMLQADNAQMPVWNESNGYVFAAANLSYERMNTTTSGLVFKSSFKPSFGKFSENGDYITKLFADAEAASDNGLRIIIRLSWMNGDNLVKQDFEYSNALVQEVYMATNIVFTLGVTSLASDADVTVQVVIASNTGAEAISEGIVYKAN